MAQLFQSRDPTTEKLRLVVPPAPQPSPVQRHREDDVEIAVRNGLQQEISEVIREEVVLLELERNQQLFESGSIVPPGAERGKR